MTIGTSVSLLQLCTCIFHLIFESRWANIISCMYCGFIRTIIWIFSIYVSFICIKEFDLFRWPRYLSWWRCVVCHLMTIVSMRTISLDNLQIFIDFCVSLRLILLLLFRGSLFFSPSWKYPFKQCNHHFKMLTYLIIQGLCI